MTLRVAGDGGRESGAGEIKSKQRIPFLSPTPRREAWNRDNEISPWDLTTASLLGGLGAMLVLGSIVYAVRITRRRQPAIVVHVGWCEEDTLPRVFPDPKEGGSK